MNKITCNEKYTCLYNQNQVMIFDSSMEKISLNFQGIKFAELDKLVKERIFLFDGSYFIETLFIENRIINFNMMNNCDVSFASVLYQHQEDELAADIVFILNNNIFFNFSGGKDFQKFEVLTCFQQASVSLVNTDKLYLLDYNNKFYCFDTQQGVLLTSFFLSDIVESSVYPNSKMKYLNYRDGERELFLNIYSNSENRSKVFSMNQDYKYFDIKNESNLEYLKSHKNSTLLEDSQDLSLSNDYFSILILKCQKQYEKKKLKEPRFFNRMIIIDNQTKRNNLVHLRLHNMVTFNNIYFNNVKNCFVLSIIYENKRVENYEILKADDEYEVKCVSNYVIDENFKLLKESCFKDKINQCFMINKNAELEKDYNYVWESLINNKIKLEKERINKYIEDYLHKLEESLSEKLYTEIKLFEAAIYEELLFTQKLKNIYSMLTNNGSNTN